MDFYVTIIVTVFLIASPLFLIAWIYTWLRLRKARRQTDASLRIIRDRYAAIISQEEEVARLKQLAADEETKASEIQISTSHLRSTYAEKRKILDQLEQQMAVYDERLALTELGVYEPHFDFTDNEVFKDTIKKVRDQQKRLITNKDAAICHTQWSVGNSAAQGQTHGQSTNPADAAGL